MIVCKVCSQQNEDDFEYCKNCGTKLEKTQQSYQAPQRPNYMPYNPYNGPVTRQSAPTASNIVNENVEVAELVSVYMMLPDVDNPMTRTLQKVFVTKRQYAAMKAAGMFGEGKSE